MTNEQLVLRIKAGENIGQNMAQLYEQVKRDIHATALRCRGYADIDDLDQEGYLALYDAVDGYDPTVGCLFLTYARYWMRQRMTRYIQNNGIIRIPMREQKRLRELQKLEDRYIAYLGRKPSEGEITGRLGPGRTTEGNGRAVADREFGCTNRGRGGRNPRRARTRGRGCGKDCLG